MLQTKKVPVLPSSSSTPVYVKFKSQNRTEQVQKKACKTIRFHMPFMLQYDYSLPDFEHGYINENFFFNTLQ